MDASPPSRPRASGPWRGSGLGLLLAVAAAMSPAMAPAADLPAEEDFGRWEQRTLSCEMRLQDSEGAGTGSFPCSSVRLDQQLAGLISLRFLPALANGSTTPRRLVFAGVLQPGSRPMRCRDGSCTPQPPIQLQVSAVATSSAASLGLPQARLASGSCSLVGRRASCQARDNEGHSWQADGRW